MAYHFRKLKNSLRLLPSSKTMGFSTRLNEGDSHNLLPIYPEDSLGSAQQGFSDLISKSLKHMARPDLCNPRRNSDPGISRSDVDLDATAQFLPAIISRPSDVLPLPVTYDDLAQILRLPAPSSADRDLVSGARPVLRVVYPTSDDILVELSHGASDFIPNNRAFKDYFGKGFRSSNAGHSNEDTPTDLFGDRCTERQSWSTWMSMMPSSTADCLSMANSHPVPTFSSNCDRDARPPSCNLFSSSSPNQAEPPSPSSNSGSAQGKSCAKNVPSPEEMQKIKEKLEKAVGKLVSGRQDYSLLHKNVVLENNLFGDNKTSVGLLAYGIEILKLRLRIHARFSNTSVELQSVTMLEQNGVIRIHWRLRGLSQIQTLKFWRLFQTKNPISKDDYEWLEAFSYFHIGKDGLVHKHRIDRMIPDDTSGTEKITNTLRELLTPAKPLVS